MTVYLASPGSQMHATALVGMPVLASYALWSDWMWGYQHSWGRVLIDSGAYSEMTGKKAVDLAEYAEWAEKIAGRVDAVAGLDDIRGDWRRSMRNYEAFRLGFPTIHDTDPAELLDDLIAMAKDRGCWIGVGLLPPREGKGDWLRGVLERIPSSIHVHGWALRLYWETHQRIDSVDSTNWWRDSHRYVRDFPWMTPAQAVQMVVWRYQQSRRMVRLEDGQLPLAMDPTGGAL